MQSLTHPSSHHVGILKRFRTLYAFFTALFTTLTIGLVAWHWYQPKSYANGFPYKWSVPILLVASLLLNGISFYFQNRYLSKLLQRPQIAIEFKVFRFALRFYLYSFATAVVLSFVFALPLLFLFFFYWVYPIVFWLIPYQAITGILLGWSIKRRLQRQPIQPEEKALD